MCTYHVRTLRAGQTTDLERWLWTCYGRKRITLSPLGGARRHWGVGVRRFSVLWLGTEMSSDDSYEEVSYVVRVREQLYVRLFRVPRCVGEAVSRQQTVVVAVIRIFTN